MTALPFVVRAAAAAPGTAVGCGTLSFLGGSFSFVVCPGMWGVVTAVTMLGLGNGICKLGMWLEWTDVVGTVGPVRGHFALLGAGWGGFSVAGGRAGGRVKVSYVGFPPFPGGTLVGNSCRKVFMPTSSPGYLPGADRGEWMVVFVRV